MLLHDTIEWELRNCSVLETAESETKTPADPVSAESPSPGSEMAAFLQCLHKVERETVSSLVSYHKGTNSIMGSPSL